MSRFIPFTEEELYTANHRNIKEVLEGLGQSVAKSGTEYLWIEHNSLKFRGHVWYQHSTGDKGTTVTLLINFFDYSFQDAVIYLLDGKYMATRNSTPSEISKIPVPYHQKAKIVLPQKHTDNKRLLGYLCKARGINISVVQYFIKCNMIYEEAEHHNIVFTGKDKKGVIKYAGLKGTLTDKPFRRELTNSDKRYCFRHIGTSNILYVFEAFIDLFSYITLFHLSMDWHKFNYIALGGLYYDILLNFLKTYPHIKTVVICTDNDYQSNPNKGQEYAKLTQTKLLHQGYNTKIHTPIKKDWNEVLKENTK